MMSRKLASVVTLYALLGGLFIGYAIAMPTHSDFGMTSDKAKAGLLEIQQRETMYYQLHCQYTENLEELGFVQHAGDPYAYSLFIPSEVPDNMAGKFYTATATKDQDNDGIWDTWTISGPKEDPSCTMYDKED